MRRGLGYTGRVDRATLARSRHHKIATRQSRSMSTEPVRVTYNPEIFNVRNLDQAKAIILTGEGSTPDDRWVSETPWLADQISDSMAIGPETILLHPETGDPYTDHAERAVWFGAMLPLRLDVLRTTRARPAAGTFATD